MVYMIYIDTYGIYGILYNSSEVSYRERGLKVIQRYMNTNIDDQCFIIHHAIILTHTHTHTHTHLYIVYTIRIHGYEQTRMCVKY